MFSRNIRFTIIVLVLVLMFISVWYGSWINFLMLLFVVLLLLYGYFRSGTVYLANKRLQQGKPEKAARLLEEIRRPEWLAASHRSYYYFCKGVIELKEERNYEAARQLFHQALDTGLRTEADEASAYLNLGVIAYQQGDKPKARQMLKKVKSMKFKPMMRVNIAILERALKNG